MWPSRTNPNPEEISDAELPPLLSPSYFLERDTSTRVLRSDLPCSDNVRARNNSSGSSLGSYNSSSSHESPFSSVQSEDFPFNRSFVETPKSFGILGAKSKTIIREATDAQNTFSSVLFDFDQSQCDHNRNICKRSGFLSPTQGHSPFSNARDFAAMASEIRAKGSAFEGGKSLNSRTPTESSSYGNEASYMPGNTRSTNCFLPQNLKRHESRSNPGRDVKIQHQSSFSNIPEVSAKHSSVRRRDTRFLDDHRNDLDLGQDESHSVRSQTGRPPNQRYHCSFCSSNKETMATYSSHNLRSKGPNGKVIISCPVLRRHVCEYCGASGDLAHTYTHCPYVIKTLGQRPTALANKFKETIHDAAGRLRKNTNFDLIKK